MLGNRFFTAALTFRFSSLLPNWATLASALRAWALSGIGYLRLPGSANEDLLSFLRSLVLLRSFAMDRQVPASTVRQTQLPIPVRTVRALSGGDPALQRAGIGDQFHRPDQLQFGRAVGVGRSLLRRRNLLQPTGSQQDHGQRAGPRLVPRLVLGVGRQSGDADHRIRLVQYLGRLEQRAVEIKGGVGVAAGPGEVVRKRERQTLTGRELGAVIGRAEDEHRNRD